MRILTPPFLGAPESKSPPFNIPDPRWEAPELLIPGKKPIGPVAISKTNSIARKIITGIYPQKPSESIYPIHDPFSKGFWGTTSGTHTATPAHDPRYGVYHSMSPFGTGSTVKSWKIPESKFTSPRGWRTLSIFGVIAATTLAAGNCYYIDNSYSSGDTMHIMRTSGANTIELKLRVNYQYLSLTIDVSDILDELFTLVFNWLGDTDYSVFVNGIEPSVTEVDIDSPVSFKDGVYAGWRIFCAGNNNCGMGNLHSMYVSREPLTDAESISFCKNPTQFMVPA